MKLRSIIAKLRRALGRGGERAALKRSYDGARVNRLTGDWTTTSTSANLEMRRSLRVLRARSRNLARNSEYIKRFLSMTRNNVSGPVGMVLQCRALTPQGEPDEALNRKVERAWQEWSHKEHASASGKLSWRDIQRKVDTHLGRDGEALVRAVEADNRFGFALKFYSADWLDETFNERRTDGNRVIMSVEIDANDRPVAYWLTPPPSDFQFLDSGARVRTRVPAAEILHLYLPDDENSDDDSQTRGTPWTHAVMSRLKMLGGYEDAVVTGARAAAAKMGFYQEKDSDAESYSGEDDDEDEGGVEFLESAQPGTFGIIPAGYEFKEYNPSSPDTNHSGFIKTEQRGIAIGLDVNYFSLAQDLEGVNYSTARVGLLDERDTWRGLQQFKKEHFCRPVFLMWLRAAMLSGALDIRVSDYKRLQEPAWHARGWAWVDPQKEAAATVTGINNGFDTITDTLAEQGRDIEQVLETRKRELKMLKDAGIDIAPAQASSPPKKPAPEEDDGD